LWRPAFPPAPSGRFEADVLLRRAAAARAAVPYRNLKDWEAGQLAGLVGAAGGGVWPAVGLDTAVRLAMVVPPPSDAVTTLGQLARVQEQRFAASRGALPLAEVYAAVRAARRGVAENPTDARAYLTLAQGYLELLENTSERWWSDRDGLSQLRRVREVQAVAALNKAVTFNRRLASAHFALAQLYRRTGCLDLAAEHLQEFLDQSSRSGGSAKDGELTRTLETELTDLKADVAARKEEYAKQTARSSVSDRALAAVQLQLGGMARDLLLKSDVSAFGAQGVELELDLLLRTGRPHDVLQWTTPEVAGSLGAEKYHWALARAHLAVGDYEAADRDLAAMAESDARPRPPEAVSEEVAAVVGKSVLDGVPRTGQLDQHVWQTLSTADLLNRVTEITRTLSRQANMTTLRGVVAMEAGNVPRAREAFADALTYSSGGQFEFGGRRAAAAGLDLTSPPPRR
jgi:tetratricopeptide (TPR) repeat protein